MKIALAQTNPTIGDIENNLRKIRSFAQNAAAKGADLCVFSELSLTGYPPHDLLERPGFVQRSLTALEDLAKSTGPMGLIVGAITTNKGRGKPLHNSAVVMANGKISSVHTKSLLPTYDVFDERRYFEPGTDVVTSVWNEKVLGISICEDIWTQSDPQLTNLYNRDPIQDLANLGTQLMINISASPFTLSKRFQRPKLLSDVAKKHGRHMLFVNQVGGNDDLVFDGQSAVYGPDGELLALCKAFDEDLVVVDLDEENGPVRNPAMTDEQAALEAITLGTRDYAQKCGFKTAVLGLSGGIDSALVAAVAARALGPKNVYCVAMPTRYSSAHSLEDAGALARNLGVNYSVMPIDDVFQVFLDKLKPSFEGLEQDVTEENIQARVRGTILMGLSNKFGHLLLTTGNKSEMATGYCTLYGDMAGGLAVLSDVPKTLVFQMCRHLNVSTEVIPQNIITKPPSAELRADQKDEDSLPPYSLLDKILELHVDMGLDVDGIVAAGHDKTVAEEIVSLVRRNEYKRRQAPPGLKITSKAFGLGRRMPMAQGWRG